MSGMELTRELKIADLEGGAIIERLDHELEEVISDCFDVNKVPDSVREVSCKIKIKPDTNRIVLMIGIETGNKLGKRHPIVSKALLDEAQGKAFEPTAKEQDMFDGEGKPAMSIVGGKSE